MFTFWSPPAESRAKQLSRQLSSSTTASLLGYETSVGYNFHLGQKVLPCAAPLQIFRPPPLPQPDAVTTTPLGRHCGPQYRSLLPWPPEPGRRAHEAQRHYGYMCYEILQLLPQHDRTQSHTASVTAAAVPESGSRRCGCPFCRCL